VFFLVKSVHRFDFKIVIIRKPNKWLPVEIHSLAETYVFDRICNLCILFKISADVRDHTHVVKVKYGHVCREQQLLVLAVLNCGKKKSHPKIFKTLQLKFRLPELLNLNGKRRG